MHYLMFYDFAPDYLERRIPVRNDHLRHVWQAHERGELVLGGPMGEPAAQGVLFFRCDSAEVPARFAEADPYFKHGVITGYKVQPWTTVVGSDAVSPLRPQD